MKPVHHLPRLLSSSLVSRRPGDARGDVQASPASQFQLQSSNFPPTCQSSVTIYEICHVRHRGENLLHIMCWRTPFPQCTACNSFYKCHRLGRPAALPTGWWVIFLLVIILIGFLCPFHCLSDWEGRGDKACARVIVCLQACMDLCVCVFVCVCVYIYECRCWGFM